MYICVCILHSSIATMRGRKLKEVKQRDENERDKLGESLLLFISFSEF